MESKNIWELADQVGGVFKLTVLLQKRVQELIRGAPRLIEQSTDDVLEIALKEVMQGKITLEQLSEEELDRNAQETTDEMAAERTLLGDPKTTKDDKLA